MQCPLLSLLNGGNVHVNRKHPTSTEAVGLAQAVARSSVQELEMTAAVWWSIILGVVATVGLFSVIPLWFFIRYPDRASHGTVPAYLRQAGAPALLKPREAPERGGVPALIAARQG